MKKILVLSIICLFVMTACAFLNPQSRIVKHEEALKRIAKEHSITQGIKVAVIGPDEALIDIVKEVFNDFGFLVVQREYRGYLDHVIEASRQILGEKHSSYYGYGYSGRSKVVCKVKLTSFDDAGGVERYYTGTQEYQYQRWYSGYYADSYSRQIDPVYIATKAAAITAVAYFIDGIAVPHRMPPKKKK